MTPMTNQKDAPSSSIKENNADQMNNTPDIETLMSMFGSGNENMTPLQMVMNLSMATILGNQANESCSSNLLGQGSQDNQVNTNALMTAFNNTMQTPANNGTTNGVTRKSPGPKKSPKQIASASPSVSNNSDGNRSLEEDEMTEEQYKAMLAADSDPNVRHCSNCFTTKTTAWRRIQQSELVCNACGLYFRLHKENRPVSMRKDTIRSRYRRKNEENIADSSINSFFSANNSFNAFSSANNSFNAINGANNNANGISGISPDMKAAAGNFALLEQLATVLNNAGLFKQ